MTYQSRLRKELFAYDSEFENAENPFTFDFAETQQGEGSGKFFDRYVYWVQQSLNQILKLQLNEDGQIGSHTLGALKKFQLPRHLQAGPDGTVCPDTEQALIAAGASPAPGIVKVIGHETPPGRTIYVDTPLQIPLDKAKSITGIFVPENYCPVPKADLIVFLHGFKVRAHDPKYSIDMYWHLPEFRLREEVNSSQKNVILVAPTLGPKNQPGSLICPGGLDKFLNQVCLALKQFGPYAGTKITPSIGNIILACHSGSEWVMRTIAMGSDAYATQIKEYWAFDPETMGSKWTTWMKSKSANLYIYYRSGRAGQTFCQGLIGGRDISKLNKVNCAKNIFAEKSTAEHDDVPRVHLKDRIQRASFLIDKSTCAGSQTRKGISAPGNMLPFWQLPFNLFRESEGMELWNGNRAKAIQHEAGTRSGPDYTRWVQQSLNQILGLRLAVDGMMGTQTRSAIRSFQQKYGLVVDGIVGAQTERALIDAGANVEGTPLPRTVQGPKCEVAAYDLEALQDYLTWLANELSKPAPDPRRLGNLRDLLRIQVDSIIANLDHYIAAGCCEPSLKTLEAQVNALPWSSDSTAQAQRVRLIQAIKQAQEKARRDFQHC